LNFQFLRATARSWTLLTADQLEPGCAATSEIVPIFSQSITEAANIAVSRRLDSAQGTGT